MNTRFQSALSGWRAAFVLGFCLSFTIAPAAHAHARLVRSIPGKNTSVSQSPGRLELWFNELLEDGFNTVQVFKSADVVSGKHTNLTTGKVMVDSADHTHLTVDIEPIPPGDYVVEWRVLSRDGHSAPGRITFRVSAAK